MSGSSAAQQWYFPDISSGTVYFHKKEHGKLYYRLVYEDSEYRHDVAEKTRGLDGVVQTTVGTRAKPPVVAPAVAKFKQTSSARARRPSGSRLKGLAGTRGISMYIPKVELIRANMSEDFKELIEIIEDNDIKDLRHLFQKLPKERVISLVNSCDDESWTPLIVACVRRDDTGMVKALLRAKAKVNHVADDGSSALDCAVQHNLEKSVDVLLAHPQLDFNVGKPVYLAAQEGHSRILDKLLAAKAAPDRMNTAIGVTPLAMACQEGHTRSVKRLLRAGASVDRKDKYGRLPLDIARVKGHHEVVAAITEHLQKSDEQTTTSTESSFFRVDDPCSC